MEPKEFDALHTSGNDHYRLTVVGIGWQISCEELQKVKLELVSLLLPCALDDMYMLLTWKSLPSL